MMNRFRLAALVALGFSLGACNLTAGQQAAQAAVTPAAIVVGSLTPGNLQSIGIDSPEAAAFATKVQTTATLACSFEPSFEGIAALVAAYYPPASPAISVAKIAGLACTAYKNRIAATPLKAYSALEAPKKPAAKTAPKKDAAPEPAPGQEVEGFVDVNGRTIVVPGVKK